VDYVILGEPEKAVAVLASGDLTENLAFRENGRVRRLKRVLLESLDWLPYPSRQLLNPRDYVAPFSRDFPFTVMTTSRGCAHNRCTFCYQNLWHGSAVRFHSVDYVIGELREAVRVRGYREIFFRDQNITSDRGFTLAWCEKMKSAGLNVPWRATSRVNYVDRELLAEMKSAGCYQISYGIESASQQVLDRCRKAVTLDQVRHAVALTREAGIETVGNFMIGLPGETPEDLRTVSDYAAGLKIDWAQFHLVQKWEESGENAGVLSEPGAHLVRLVGRAYRRFYLRPSFAWKMIKRLGRWRIFKAAVLSAFRIITEKQVF
jgi:anaerobic magnesium-protoporphyrin IX monomethyl ester cyclase